MSTHIICFGREIRKLVFNYAHLSRASFILYWFFRHVRLSSLLHKYGEKICEASGEQSADPTGFSPLEGSLTQVDKVIFFHDKMGLEVRKMTSLYSNNKAAGQPAHPHMKAGDRI